MGDKKLFVDIVKKDENEFKLAGIYPKTSYCGTNFQMTMLIRKGTKYYLINRQLKVL